MGSSNVFVHSALNYVGESSDQSLSWMYVESFIANGSGSSGNWPAIFINGCTQVTWWLECTF